MTTTRRLLSRAGFSRSEDAISGPPLRTERFGRRYRRNHPWAVRDVTVEIAQGSIAALVGPNGAGKSTLIRACLGFERPDEGRVFVAGLDPTHDRTAVVNSIGYVPQAASLYRNLTIRDHLDMASVGRTSFDRQYAYARIRALGLSEQRPVAELSGGEQAQVALALALGARAPVLLLDEPLASLDPLARRDFLTTVVEDVHERGATAVLSSHIVTDIEQACDHLLVLAGGRLVLDAAVAAAKAEHRTVAADEVDGGTRIATFTGPDGEPLALLRDVSRGLPASLEEIVLGYLAAAKTGYTPGDS